MVQNNKVNVGRELASITSSYKEWPAATISEAGFCQLRDSRGKEQRLNRHYAVSGPSLFDIDRSFRSHKNVDETVLYAMMSFIEYGQYEDSDCVMALSSLKAQIKVEHLRYCRKGHYIGQEPRRYVKLRGHVHQICGIDSSPIFCSNSDCRAAMGKPTNGMYYCGMMATPQVVEVGDRVEILYDTRTDTGRILGVVRLGKAKVDLYSFVPEKFITAGGFANVTLDIILTRAN